MASTALSLSRNGTIELDDATQTVQVMKMLEPKERSYVNRITSEITELTLLEESLVKEEAKLLRQLAASDAAQKLKKLRARKKLISSSRNDKVQKALGVMEAAYQEFMPGASFGEKVMAMLPAPEDLPKKAGRASGRGGKRS